jgi:hypothetical protein
MRHLFLASLFCLAACVTPAAPPAARGACERATFPDNPAIAAAFTDKFHGRYWNNKENVTVWREAQRLYIGAPQGSRVQLQPTTPVRGSGAFRDACGTSYDFYLPPDGPGGYVVITEPNGARSEWHRRV